MAYQTHLPQFDYQVCLHGVGYQQYKGPMSPGDIVIVERDERYRKDSNALRVVENNAGIYRCIGWIPKEISKELSPLIDNGSITLLSATCTEVNWITIRLKPNFDDVSEFRTFIDKLMH